MDDISRTLDVTAELQVAGGSLILIAGRATTARVPVERLVDLGAGIDSSITAQARLSNGTIYRSATTVPAIQIDIIEILEAHGGVVEGPDARARLRDYSLHRRTTRLLGKYRDRGWLRTEMDQDGNLVAIEFLRGPSDDTNYNELRQLLSLKKSGDGFPMRISEADIAGDTQPTVGDGGRPLHEIVADFEKRGWVEAQWDSVGELARFEIVNLSDSHPDLNTLRTALEQLDTTGEFVEFVADGSAQPIYNTDGQICGLEFFSVARDLMYLQNAAIGVAGVSRETNPLRLKIEDLDRAVRSNESVVHAILRIARSEDLKVAAGEDEARIVRDTDGDEIGFVIKDESSLLKYWSPS